MTKTDLQFIIDQLRKDNIISATEATAGNILCLLLMLTASVLLNSTPFSQLVVFSSAIFLAVSLTIYKGIGNYRRLQHIKELETQLYREK
jgi:uncharacterized membrane protein YjfL (UPF0719 family)